MVSKKSILAFGIRQGIARKLILYLLTFSSFVTLILTSIQLYLEYNRDIRLIEDRMELIEKSHLAAISSGLWSFDEKLMKVQLEGILQMPDMQYLEIRPDLGALLSAGTFKQSNVIRKEFSLSFLRKEKKIPVGTLIVDASLSGVYQRLLNRVLIILLSQSIKTFLVSLFIFFIFYYLITRHLNTLADYVSDFDLNRLDNKLTLNRRQKTKKGKFDELDKLVSGINQMRSNLLIDITERKVAEEALRESEEKFKTLVTNTEEIVYMISKDGTFLLSEGKGLAKLGLKAGQVVGKSVFELYKNYPDMLDAMKKAFDGETTTTEIHVEGNYFRNWYTPHINLDGEVFGLMGLSINITEQKLAEEQIKSSLKEKETLIDEIHHRVKNNMAVIASLLKLQANSIEDDRIKEVLKESQTRVYAMSAVHEILHGSENLSEINLKTYLSKITTSVFQTYSVNPDKVKLKNDVEEIPISINQASPLGLIINELISNSLKYAFPDEKKGEINVSIKKLDKELELTVMDNGVGIPDKLDWRNSSTLGLKLVRTLVENQLDGSIDMESNNGTKFTIKFNIET